jgi:hypothetical protein
MPLLNTFPPESNESGLGYYRRLAAGNALWGWRELARMAQVSSHRSGLFGRPEFVATQLGLESAWTQQATAAESAAKGWKGLHRLRADAICPACLTESVYIRSFWEHAYVTACPQHRTVLIDRCPSCNDWLHPSRDRIEQCGCGQDLRTATTQAATNEQLWLSALLISEGVSSAGIQPKLRHVSSLALSELVKLLCLHADPQAVAPRRNSASPATVQEAVEFLRPLPTLLANWPQGFEQHIRHRIEAGNQEARTLNSLLGRWYQQLKKVCADDALRVFLETVLRVSQAAFDGVLTGDTAAKLVPDLNDHIRLADAAKRIGVSRDRLLKALRDGECRYRTRRFGTRVLVHEVPITEVERLVPSRCAWVDEARAAELLDVPASVLQLMVDSRVLTADVKWRYDIHKGGLVLERSIHDLLETLTKYTLPAREQDMVEWQSLTSRRMGEKAAIQRAMQAALAGELRAVRVARTVGGMAFRREDVMRHFCTPLLEAGMSVQQLAKATGWKWESIAHWIDEGLLQSRSILLRGQQCRVVMPEHLLEFRRQYLPLADLAHAMDTRPSYLVEQLRDVELLGAKPLPNGQRRGGLLRMSELGKLAVQGCRHLSDSY